MYFLSYIIKCNFKAITFRKKLYPFYFRNSIVYLHIVCYHLQCDIIYVQCNEWHFCGAVFTIDKIHILTLLWWQRNEKIYIIFFTIIYAFQLCEGSRHMVPITLENDRSIALTLTYSLRLLYKHCNLCVDIVLEYITQWNQVRQI